MGRSAPVSSAIRLSRKGNGTAGIRIALVRPASERGRAEYDEMTEERILPWTSLKRLRIYPPLDWR